MKRVIPDLHVENAKEALDYYQNLFGGEVKNVQMADGKDMFKGHEGKVIHSELHINDNCILYLVDVLGEKPAGGNIGLLLEMESEEEVHQVYEALRQDATVKYPLQKTFWGADHAVVIDRFGITWSLNYSQG